jgi:hypothetical protein
MKNNTLTSESNKSEKEVWRKEIKKGNNTTCVEVRELDNNGFIVSLSKWGYNKKNEYINEPSKEFYSKTNPLSDEDKSNDDYNKLQELFMSPVEKLMKE